RRAFNETFAENGLDWHWTQDDYRMLLRVTGGKERMAAHRANVGYGPDDAVIARLHAEKTERYGTIIAAGGLTLRPGVAEVMDAARKAGLALAVATTTSRPNVEALSQAVWGCPAEKVFDVIAAGDEVAAKKPAPDVFNLALERLAVPAAAALAFEDSRNGVLSAKAAGLRVIVTPSLYTSGDDLSQADWCLPGLDARPLPAPLAAALGSYCS
ncbi:MAG: HAD-IA family hydrolase, partial [Albidovulum sp.]